MRDRVDDDQEYWVKMKIPGDLINFIIGMTPQRAGSALEAAGCIIGNAISNSSFDCTITPSWIDPDMPTVEKLETDNDS